MEKSQSTVEICSVKTQSELVKYNFRSKLQTFFFYFLFHSYTPQLERLHFNINLKWRESQVLDLFRWTVFLLDSVALIMQLKNDKEIFVNLVIIFPYNLKHRSPSAVNLTDPHCSSSQNGKFTASQFKAAIDQLTPTRLREKITLWK